MKAYLTLLGRSTWALINSYYAVVEERDYHPDRVIIYTEAPGESGQVSDAIMDISKEYGFNPAIEVKHVYEGDFIKAVEAVGGELRRLKDEGCETALDITPGRKALVAGAVLSAPKLIDHMYYLMIDSTDDADKPYMLIPRRRQTLIDFAEEARRHAR